MSEAVVICTRNRPEALARTLESVAEQHRAHTRPVVVVDGSDPEAARETARVVQCGFGQELPFSYHRYAGPPAGARQRNAGVDRLPASTEIVHFIDDDVTLLPGYFAALLAALRRHPSLLGVGGVVVPEDGSARPTVHWAHRLFLLRTDRPSRVLPSGRTTPAWPTGDDGALQSAEWLSTCASSYRAAVFEEHRFDPAVEGPSPRLEDLDFSVRVAQDGPLAVAPDARCIHRTATENRRGTAAAARERVVRRYWFIQKNMDRPENRLAFWWSVLGQLVALATSTRPTRGAALRGHLRGIRQAWTRAHSLLREEATDP